MSHLSTIIQRVQKQARLENEENLKKNVANIRDYIEAWDDYSEKELVSAAILYDKYYDLLPEEEQKQLPLSGSPSKDLDLSIEEGTPVLSEELYEEKQLVASRMVSEGGSFVSQLGELLVRADRENTLKIKEVWSEFYQEYGGEESESL